MPVHLLSEYVVTSDDGQPVAVVPLTEDQEDWMETSSFQQLMQFCGLYPPASEQVTDTNDCVV